MFNYTDWYDKVSLVIITFVLIVGSLLFISYKYHERKAKSYFEEHNLNNENKKE